MFIAIYIKNGNSMQNAWNFRRMIHDLYYDLLQFHIESVNTYFSERQENMITGYRQDVNEAIFCHTIGQTSSL